MLQLFQHSGHAIIEAKL